MSNPIQTSLNQYSIPEFKPAWGSIRRGIEKECLRVTPAGHISTRQHPEALGSALTNPYITTDFSEALLEFITPAYADIQRLPEDAGKHSSLLSGKSRRAGDVLGMQHAMPLTPGY